MRERRWVRWIVIGLPVVAAASFGCSKKGSGDRPAPAQSAPATTQGAAGPATVPPVLLSAAPVAEFSDAASAGGKPPYEQAVAYEANGQLWLARLVLERKALGPDGTPREVELLAGICQEQGDEICVDACSARLGRKLELDAGVGRRRVAATGEHEEPSSDAARARDLILAHRPVDARKLLEAKVIDGRASKEEVRLLKTACQEQGDRMCIALCDAKLN